MEAAKPMMNNEMMRQLQARIQKMQEDLATQTVEASAGGGAVTVTISEIGMGPAQARVQRVKISPEAVDPEDIETLEDLVVAAVNEAGMRAAKTRAAGSENDRFISNSSGKRSS